MQSIHEPPLSFDQLRTVLTVALRAGQLLMEFGADTQRVEDTITRIGRALGADSLDVYVTPTGIIATISDGQEHRTKIRRVTILGIDLARLHALNQLSRRIAPDHMTVRDVEIELERIAMQPRQYGRWTTIAIVALACACFSLLFGGGWREFVAVLGGAPLVLIVRQELIKLRLNLLLQIAPAAFVGALGVALIGWLVGTTNLDLIIPAAVLSLVPGVPLINALVDLFASDFVSGVTRAAQALLIAAEIAIGVALALDLIELFAR